MPGRAHILWLALLTACGNSETTAPAPSPARGSTVKETNADGKGSGDAKKATKHTAPNAVQSSSDAPPSDTPDTKDKLSANAGVDPATTAFSSTYHGKGTATASAEGHSKSVAVEQVIKAEKSNQTFTLTVQSMTSADPSFNSAMQARVGTTNYALADLNAAKIAVDRRFLLFADSASGSHGDVKFSAPLPVSVYPGTSADRYKALDSGPLTFSVKAASGAQTFTINVAITGRPEGGQYQLDETVDIPEDTDGTLYLLVGLAHAETLTVDFKADKITAISSDLFYHADQAMVQDVVAAKVPAGILSEIPSSIVQQEEAKVPPRQPMHLDYTAD